MNKMRAYRAYFLQLSKSQWGKKSCCFVEGTRVMQTFGLAYRITSFQQHSIKTLIRLETVLDVKHI